MYPYAASYPPHLAWDYVPLMEPLGSVLDRAVARYPERVAVNFLGRTLTFFQISREVQNLAAALQSRGVGKGDRVALCLPNCPAAVVAYYAIVNIGAVVVNTNPLYTEAELKTILDDSGAKVIVTTNLAVSFGKLVGHVGKGGVRHMVVVDFTRQLPWYMGLFFKVFKNSQVAVVPRHGQLSWYHQVVGVGVEPRAVAIKPAEDLAVIQYTGGTTGTPKGAMLSHQALRNNVEQIRLWLGDTPPEGDRVLAVLPLFHCFAMTVCMNLTFANGGQIHLLPQFNLQQVLRVMHKQRITLLPGVPTLFNAMVQAPKLKAAWFKSLRYGISGGAPLPPDVKEAFESLTGSRLMEGYGLTEASPVVCCNPRHKASKTGSAGLALPGTHVSIRNPDNLKAKPLAEGEVGEVWVQGPQVMQGYWNNPDATAACMVKGWLRTGDLGFVDAEGYVHLTDRIKDIILVNGYNVYPRVIEDCLHAHPDVAEVMVIGLPDAKKGEAPHAYVVLKDGANVTADGLLSFARQHLNPMERPVAVVLRQQLPKTQVGKLSKKDLRAEVLGK